MSEFRDIGGRWTGLSLLLTTTSFISWKILVCLIHTVSLIFLLFTTSVYPRSMHHLSSLLSSGTSWDTHCRISVPKGFVACRYSAQYEWCSSLRTRNLRFCFWIWCFRGWWWLQCCCSWESNPANRVRNDHYQETGSWSFIWWWKLWYWSLCYCLQCYQDNQKHTFVKLW